MTDLNSGQDNDDYFDFEENAKRVEEILKNQLINHNHFQDNNNEESDTKYFNYNFPLTISSNKKSKNESNKKDDVSKNSKLTIISDLKEKYYHKNKINERYKNNLVTKIGEEHNLKEIIDENHNEFYNKKPYDVSCVLNNTKEKDKITENTNFLKIEDQQLLNFSETNITKESKSINKENLDQLSNSNNTLNFPKLNFDLLNSKDNEQINTNSIYNLILTTNNLTDVSFREDERLKLFECKMKNDLKDSLFDFSIDEKITSKTLRKFLKIKTLVKEFSEILPNELKIFFKTLMDLLLANMDYVLIYYNLSFSKICELEEKNSEMCKLLEEKKNQIESLTSIFIETKTGGCQYKFKEESSKDCKKNIKHKSSEEFNLNDIKSFNHNKIEEDSVLIEQNLKKNSYDYPLQINKYKENFRQNLKNKVNIDGIKCSENRNNFNYKRNNLTKSLEKNKECDFLKKEMKITNSEKNKLLNNENNLLNRNKSDCFDIQNTNINLKRNTKSNLLSRYKFTSIDFNNFKSLIISSSFNKASTNKINIKFTNKSDYNYISNTKSKSVSKSKSKSKSKSENFKKSFISSGRKLNMP